MVHIQNKNMETYPNQLSKGDKIQYHTIPMLVENINKQDDVTFIYGREIDSLWGKYFELENHQNLEIKDGFVIIPDWTVTH